MVATLLERWKEILVSVGVILTVLLQIVNVILSNDIENSLGVKAGQMATKAADLQKLVQQINADDVRQTEAVQNFGKQLSGHVETSQKILETLRPSPTPR